MSFHALGLFMFTLCVCYMNATGQEFMKDGSFEVQPADTTVQGAYVQATALNDDDIQVAVDLINNLRQNVNPGPASNMKYMEWDVNLATMAQQWADTCNVAIGYLDNLSPFTVIGQTLYYSSSLDTDVTNALTYFNSKGSDYNYEANNCSNSCIGYLKIVWAETDHFGCGVTFCQNPAGVFYDELNIINCYFGGDHSTFRPYRLGPPCTQCTSGVGHCYNNLCRPCANHGGNCDCQAVCHNNGLLQTDCTCDCPAGRDLADCSQECGDIETECDDHVYYCSVGNEYSLYMCHLTCGICNAEATAAPVCDVPCLNNGVCNIDSIGVQTCDCPRLFTGPTCKIVVAYCPCHDQG